MCVCDHKSDHVPVWASCSGKGLKRLKERPRDATRALCTGSPGEAGWMRLYTTIMDREGTASMGEETKMTCVPKTTYVIYDYATYYARRNHSCMTKTPRNETLKKGDCLLIRCVHQ